MPSAIVPPSVPSCLFRYLNKYSLPCPPHWTAEALKARELLRRERLRSSQADDASDVAFDADDSLNDSFPAGKVANLLSSVDSADLQRGTFTVGRSLPVPKSQSHRSSFTSFQSFPEFQHLDGERSSSVPSVRRSVTDTIRSILNEEEEEEENKKR